jgi:hypothetical protein
MLGGGVSWKEHTNLPMHALAKVSSTGTQGILLDVQRHSTGLAYGKI